MVGVCLTGIGILHLIFDKGKLKSISDDLLGLDALFFIASCLLAYERGI